MAYYVDKGTLFVPSVNMSSPTPSPFPLRLKQARLLRGFSLRELSDRMENVISHVSLAKYEDGTTKPSGDMLAKLCAALEVSPDSLFRPTTISVGQVSFRKRKAIPEKQATMLLEGVRARLENYIETEELLSSRIEFKQPALPTADAREAARELRRLWGLGDQPIADVTELLEKQGIRVIEINEAIDHFDGCQLAGLNVIVASGLKELPVTRKRFTLAHELGHLLLDPALAKHRWDEKQLEKFMNGFASEFLFPSRAVRTFFGGPRTTVTIEELMSAKLRYGISICAIVYAMHELELISDNANQRFLTKTRNEWRDENRVIREPGDIEVNQLYCEKPERFERLVMRGLAEGNLSLSRAAGLLGKRLSDIRKGAAPAVE